MIGVPVLYDSTQISKDASEDFKITYKWDGNNPQQTGNEIRIYDNASNQLVYHVTTTNIYKQECTIPAHTLTNGTLYKACVCVICSEGISNASEPMLFYCYTTPEFAFANLVENQIIENDTFQATLIYTQPEGEELEDYYISLYSHDHNELYTSSIRYETTNMTLTIPGLQNNTQYYVKAFGKTITGMNIETAFIPINVRYLQPTLYSLVELDNNTQDGYTNIKSNIVSLRARVYKNGTETDPIYVDGEYIDLRNDTDVLKFADSFVIPDDFTIELKGFGFERNSAPFVAANGKYRISVYYRIGCYDSVNGAEKAYFEARVENEMVYTIYSNYIDMPLENGLIGFMLSRKNNIYEICSVNYGREVDVT